MSFEYSFIIGRATAHDVSAFAKDSMTTKLESLTLDDFQSQRVGPSSQSMWFIDFFAPVSIFVVYLSYRDSNSCCLMIKVMADS